MKVNKKIAYLEKVIKQKDQDIKLLTDKIDFLLQQMFGKKSEIINSAQLLFALEGLDHIDLDDDDDTPPPTTPKPRKKRKSAKERLPDDLPEVREYVDDPDEVKADPSAYNCIGEEETVKLEVTPARFFKKIKVRRKFVKKDGKSAPVASQLPPQLIEKSIASPSLLAYIADLKYVNHIPLFRQEQMFSRQGIEISRKRMSEWMFQVGNSLNPICEFLKQEIKEYGYLQIDETTTKYIVPGKGKAMQGYLWAYHSIGIGVVYEWHPGRSAECLTEMLNNFDGVMQTDGYEAYSTYNKRRVCKKQDELIHSACWAHVRRKFFEAQNDSNLAKRVLLKINEMYRIERKLREEEKSNDERLQVRQESTVKIIKEIKKLLDGSVESHLPQGLTGKAIRYTLKLWDKLIVFLDDGRVEIDNNLVENKMRPLAIGRKNWLFFGSKDSGQQSAVIYSLVETCKMLGINPQEYLLDVLQRLPSMTNQNVEQLTPSRWLAEREQQKIAS
ncbi:MAG: IS66 family transposase [Kiritimatiellae bacterium]|jgi:transposase|nr:IS66 family transposase [Kiritimatiellia bacterium]